MEYCTKNKRKEVTMIKNLLVTTLAGALLLGATSSAQATFIATAINEVTNFNIVGIDPAAAPLTFTSTIAVWNGLVASDQDDIDAVLSTASSTGNPGLPENVFTMLADGTSSWSRADSLIVNADFFGGTGATSNVAEAQAAPDLSGLTQAQADGVTGYAFIFNVGTNGATIDISFDADPYLEASVGLADAQWAIVFAETRFIIGIDDNLGGSVFQWQPDNLNFSVEQQSTGSTIIDGPSAFYQNTIELGEGEYVFSMNMNAEVSAAQQGAAIPEPTTIALLSLGLVGLGFTRRKMKA